MAQNNDLLILGGLALAAFTLGKPLTQTGTSIADTVGGVGGSIVDLTEDITGITGAASEAGAETFGIITDLSKGVREAINAPPKANPSFLGGSLLRNALINPKGKKLTIPKSPLNLNFAGSFITNPFVKKAQEQAKINIRTLKSARANIEIANISGDTSLLAVHTPLVRFTGTGSSSSKSVKRTQPAPAGSIFEKAQTSGELSNTQKTELSDNLKKLGWV